MNVLNKVIWQTMKQNRVRTIVTIIGTVLSAALFTAVITFCSSAMNYLYKTYTYESGTAHVEYENGTMEQYQELAQDDRVERLTAVTAVGYSQLTEKNNGVPYLFLASGEAEFLEEMSVRLVEGSMPKNAGEVVIPSSLFRLDSEAYGIGNWMELNLGLRKTDEGYEWNNQYCAYDAETGVVQNEMFEEFSSFEHTYRAVITGVYDAYYTGGAAYMVMTCGQEALTKAAVLDLYVTLKEPSMELDDFCCEHFGEDYRTRWDEIRINEELLMFEGSFEYVNESYFVLSLAAIVIVLVAAGSFLLIYSAFSISVGERTRQFGLLASIGASRKQIRRMVFVEVLTVAAIGIPAGMIFGVGGMGTALFFLGDKFGEFRESVYRLDLHVNLWVLLLAAGIAAATILLSAWVPAKRAAGVSAIETIRQTRDIRVSRKQIRVSWLFENWLGMEGILAKKYYKRDRKKYRVTVLSLMASVMLVFSVSGLTMQLNRWLESYDSGNVDAMTWLDYKVALRALDTIRGLGSVDEVTAGCASGMLDIYKEPGKVTTEYEQSEISGMLHINYIDTSTYEQLLKACGYDHAWKQYQETGEAMGLVLNSENYVDYRMDSEGKVSRIMAQMTWFRDGVTELLKAPAVETLAAGAEEVGGYLMKHQWLVDESGEILVRAFYCNETGEMVGERDYQPEILPIGGLIEQVPFGFGENSSSDIRILYPFSVCPDFKIDGQSAAVWLCFKTQNANRMIEDVIRVLETSGVICDPGDFINQQEAEKERENTALVIQVFSNGFLVLISLIAAVNLFNTISTNLILRRRDLAMLTSIGMTESQKRRMLRSECGSCVLRALLWGSAAGMGLLLLIRQSFSLISEPKELIPWHSIGWLVVGIVLIVTVTMRYTLRRLEREPLMEVLRRESV